MRRALAITGRALISAGVLLLLFVAYELWGTNISEARNQSSLAQQWHAEQARRPSPTGAATGSTTTTTPAPALPGGAIGIIRIPKIGLQKYLVEGVGETDLMKGPGHYPGTPMPGQAGNVAIAGHRTTYGAPFYNLDKLGAGDEIDIQTSGATTWHYQVTRSQVVLPDDVQVIAPEPGHNLTLTTCNPRFSASQRLVVDAVLMGASKTTPPTAVPARGAPTAIPGDAPVASADQTSGSSAAIPDVVGWGLGAGLVWLAAWVLARRGWRGRRWGWPAYLAGAPAFLVLLYFFFENVTRLLPSNV